MTPSDRSTRAESCAPLARHPDGLKLVSITYHAQKAAEQRAFDPLTGEPLHNGRTEAEAKEAACDRIKEVFEQGILVNTPNGLAVERGFEIVGIARSKDDPSSMIAVTYYPVLVMSGAFRYANDTKLMAGGKPGRRQDRVRRKRQGRHYRWKD